MRIYYFETSQKLDNRLEMAERRLVEMSGYISPAKIAERQRRKQYSPTDEQINTAARRIVVVIQRHKGYFTAASHADAINRLARKVYNRGDQLGRWKNNEFKTVLSLALQKLAEERLIDIDFHEGVIHCPVKEDRSNKREHRQKYPRKKAA